VRVGSIQSETFGASLVMAAAALLVAGMAGHLSLGAGLGAGLVIGGLNGFTFQAVLDRRAPILVTSFLRLGFFSLVALIAARIVGESAWPVVIGIGVAQLVMVGVSVRQGRRV
jgi:hypothetical protein